MTDVRERIAEIVRDHAFDTLACASRGDADMPLSVLAADRILACVREGEGEPVRRGVVAAMEMLREVGKTPGTDVQAFDHVIRRIQDLFGGWDNQVRIGCERAAPTPRGASGE